MPFTVYAVKNLPAKETAYDAREPGGRSGFVVRVLPSGRKTWCTIYTLDGRRCRMKHGTFPAMSLKEAQQFHNDARGLIGRGVDPIALAREQAERERAAQEASRLAREEAARRITVKQAAKLYLDLYAKPRKRSWKEDERQLKKDVLPTWGHRPVDEVTKQDVQRLLDSVVERGAPVAANRLKALLGRMFRWLEARGYVPLNPSQGIEAPAPERARDRVLTEEEIRAFWAGLDRTDLSESVRRALRLILVTAQRPGEVAGMRFEEIAEQNGRPVWTIPASRRKKEDTHLVPLSPLALEIIGEWEDRTGPVFPGLKDRPEARSSVTTAALAYALRRNVGEVAIEPLKKHGKRKRHPIPVAAFTSHDLRRSAATRMSDAGVPGLVKPLILGHQPAGITQKVYDLHEYLEEKRQALDAWGRHLTAILSNDRQDAAGTIRGGEAEAPAP